MKGPSGAYERFSLCSERLLHIVPDILPGLTSRQIDIERLRQGAGRADLVKVSVTADQLIASQGHAREVFVPRGLLDRLPRLSGQRRPFRRHAVDLNGGRKANDHPPFARFLFASG